MARYFDEWQPYVPVASRRWQAARELQALRKSGQTASPVRIDGRKIAATFWGKAWCANLERYSDYSNRLPRGRSYVRNGSVVDLRIEQGTVTALVSGSSLYRVRIAVGAVAKARWQGVCRDCTGAIDSLVELLQGHLSPQVMGRICEPKTGLFPEPRDMTFDCSCPDWASMCKHVAATLYGVGARFDAQPELLFLLRGVNQEDLVARAGAGLQSPGAAGGKVLDSGDLSQIFGIEIAEPVVAAPARAVRGTRKAPKAAVKPATPVAVKRARALKPAARKAPARPKARAGTVNAAATKALAKSKAGVARANAAISKPAAADEKASPRTRRMSAAMRKAVSERMKKYWRAWRRRRS
jgi:uncharacterized Zn finger protein